MPRPATGTIIERQGADGRVTRTLRFHAGAALPAAWAPRRLRVCSPGVARSAAHAPATRRLCRPNHRSDSGRVARWQTSSEGRKFAARGSSDSGTSSARVSLAAG